MTTVTQRLDALIQQVIKAGNTKAPITTVLIQARGRIQHLEGQLAATETMRDRIAMQLLPSTLADRTLAGRDLEYSDELSIAYAYELADKVLAIRLQGSAGVLGETTSPEIPIREYKVGDQFKLRGETVTIDGVDASGRGPRRYSWTFPSGGGEGDYTAHEIATMQIQYGDA